MHVCNTRNPGVRECRKGRTLTFMLIYVNGFISQLTTWSHICSARICTCIGTSSSTCDYVGCVQEARHRLRIQEVRSGPNYTLHLIPHTRGVGNCTPENYIAICETQKSFVESGSSISRPNDDIIHPQFHAGLQYFFATP